MSENTDPIERIIPERTLQRIADDHDYTVDALRAEVREDLERNQRMADEIIDRREVVHRDDDYVVVRASASVSTETRIPVLAVYEQIDHSENDWVAGYPLVVPTTECTDDEYPYDLESDDDERDLDSLGNTPDRYRGTSDSHSDVKSGDRGVLGADLVDPDSGDDAGDDG